MRKIFPLVKLLESNNAQGQAIIKIEVTAGHNFEGSFICQ